MLISKSKQRISPFFRMGVNALAISSLLLTGVLNRPVQSMDNGKAAFEVAPRLTRTSAIGTEPGATATYYFTIAVPPESNQSLQAIRISQVGGIESLRFDTNQIRASLGNRFAKDSLVPLTSIGGSNESGLVIPFQTPIMPGQSVTVALEVERNPNFEGVYQFGVTAYPVGENSVGLYLGTGRIDYHYGR